LRLGLVLRVERLGDAIVTGESNLTIFY